MSAIELDSLRAEMDADNARQPATLQLVPRTDWPDASPPKGIVAVMRSATFLVQIFGAAPPARVRLSICRTSSDDAGGWKDGITWDELQQVKAEAGFADDCAVEVFPPAGDLVNAANIRHLWVLHTPPAFVWRSQDHG